MVRMCHQLSILSSPSLTHPPYLPLSSLLPAFFPTPCTLPCTAQVLRDEIVNGITWAIRNFIYNLFHSTVRTFGVVYDETARRFMPLGNCSSCEAPHAAAQRQLSAATMRFAAASARYQALKKTVRGWDKRKQMQDAAE